MPTPGQPGPSAADRAYTIVRERILSGEVPGGTLLSEGEIASELGMSRTPVREAFLTLQAEGWMQLFPKKGALVRPIQPGEITEVIEARHLIESAAARRALTAAATSEQLTETLTSLIEEQRIAATADDLRAFAEVDLAFHQAIVDAGQNTILACLYSQLRDRQRRMTARSVHARSDRVAAILDQHLTLLSHVAASDPDAFTDALLAHMYDIHQGLLP